MSWLFFSGVTRILPLLLMAGLVGGLFYLHLKAEAWPFDRWFGALLLLLALTIFWLWALT